MITRQYYSLSAGLAKRLIPKAGGLLSGKETPAALRFAEVGSQITQGKGCGSGWDLDGAVTDALRFLGSGATIFNVGANRGGWSLAVIRRLPRAGPAAPTLPLRAASK